MKKLLALILAAAMTLSLASCASEDTAIDPAVDTQPASEDNTTPESRRLELVLKSGIVETFDIGFEVIPETVTPTGATFRFTNTDQKTIWFGYNFDITVMVYGSENDIIVPEADVPDGEWTVEAGMSVDVEMDWSNKYGALPDGTYRLYMYPNYTDSQIGIPMAAEFAIGSGEFSTDGVDMSVSDELADEDIFGFRLTGMNGIEEILLVPFACVDDTVTPTGAKFTVDNQTGYDVEFDQLFTIAAYIDGRYYDIATMFEDAPWEPAPSYVTVTDGETYEFDLDWDWHYGELPDGEYAVFKLMSAFDMGVQGFAEARFKVGGGEFSEDILAQADGILAQIPQTTTAPVQTNPIGSLGDALEKQKISKREDLYITVDEDSISPTGAFFTFKNERDEQVLYGSSYKVAKKVDGEWRWLVKNEMIAFPAIALYLEPGEELLEYIYWEDLYGELENGDYMLVKDFNIHHGQVSHDIICEFSVSNYGESVKPGDIWKMAAWVNEPDYIYIDNFDMNVSESSASGAKIVIKNDRDTPVLYGHDYAVCKKMGSKWYFIKYIDIYDITTEAFPIESGGEVTLDLNWEKSYGELPAGEYCIRKTFLSEDKPFANNSPMSNTPYQSAEVYAEFTVRNEVPSTVEVTEVDGVSMRIEDITAMMLTYYVDNNTAADIAFGPMQLEAERGGVWYVIDSYDGEPFGSRIRSGDYSGMIKKQPEGLDVGHYRAVVPIYQNYSETPAGNVDNKNLGKAKYIATEFEITLATPLAPNPEFAPGKTSTESDLVTGSIDGFTMTIDPETLSARGASFIYKNDSKKNISYGSMWHVEREVEGKWYFLVDMNTNGAWPAIQNWVGAGETIVDDVEFTGIYGILPSGHYRYAKRFAVGERGEDVWFAVEFDIE